MAGLGLVAFDGDRLLAEPLGELKRVAMIAIANKAQKVRRTLAKMEASETASAVGQLFKR